MESKRIPCGVQTDSMPRARAGADRRAGDTALHTDTRFSITTLRQQEPAALRFAPIAIEGLLTPTHCPEPTNSSLLGNYRPRAQKGES